MHSSTAHSQPRTTSATAANSLVSSQMRMSNVVLWLPTALPLLPLPQMLKPFDPMLHTPRLAQALQWASLMLPAVPIAFSPPRMCPIALLPQLLQPSNPLLPAPTPFTIITCLAACIKPTLVVWAQRRNTFPTNFPRPRRPQSHNTSPVMSLHISHYPTVAPLPITF